MSNRSLAAIVALAGTLAAVPARAQDVGVVGSKLVIVDKIASTSKAKTVFVSKGDPGIATGVDGDPALIEGALDVFYTDQPSSVAGSFVIPAPWLLAKPTVAKYVNKLAPAGGDVKVAVVKPGSVAKIVAKGLGDGQAIDLSGGAPGAGGVTVVLSVNNGNDFSMHRMCSRFAVGDGSTLIYKSIAGGTGYKLVGKNGVAAACPAVEVEMAALASAAEPAETPGSPGAVVTNPNLVTQFGGSSFSLNNATYSRYHRAGATGAPDAILVLVPGFEGGASSFKILAENLIHRAWSEAGLAVEVWAFDRRGNQLEDRAGIAVASGIDDPLVALDWFYGAELGLPLSPALSGLGRRAIFHNATSDVAFMANWTSLVFSQDLDAVVDLARATAQGQNVFLGGHSAGTGFIARYAATDFDLSGGGPVDAGYAKLRGLVLLEGGGGTTATSPSPEELDQIEDKADGGLFTAVRDQAPRCADGSDCSANGDDDCAGIGKGTCTEPTFAYAIVSGVLNPRVLASAEPTVIQGRTDFDSGQGILQVNQGSGAAIGTVPDLGILVVLPQSTVAGGLGSFLDDDGFVSASAVFVRTSVGATGPVVGGLTTWLDISEGPMPAAAVPNNGPAPTAPATTGPQPVWGQEKEVTDLHRMLDVFVAPGPAAAPNFTDWYYPSAGLSTTTGISLDSTALSVGRGRRDIENLTQAGNVDIPVIAFGATNGLTPLPGNYTAFGQSIGLCTAPSCDGTTPRVVDANLPNTAFPTLGGVAGGFEVHLSEGFAHVDIVTAQDGPASNVVKPLLAFIERNLQ